MQTDTTKQTRQVHELALTSFFDSFAADFAQFNGALIAMRYHTPYLATNAQGKMTLFMEAPAIAAYFQTFLDQYHASGARSCRYHDLAWLWSGNCTLLAIVTWELLNQENAVVSAWRESYSLLEQEAGLSVFASSDF